MAQLFLDTHINNLLHSSFVKGDCFKIVINMKEFLCSHKYHCGFSVLIYQNVIDVQ